MFIIKITAMPDLKLTANDIALYLGAKAQTPVGIGRIEAVNTEGQVRIEHPDGHVTIMPEDDVYPILRRLSDMTEEEGLEVYRACVGDDWPPAYGSVMGWIVRRESEHLDNIDHAIGYPAAWRCLLSRHFDLFGWIDAGLAIDAVTLTEINETP